MAKSFSNVKSLSLFISNAMVRRGYADAAPRAEAKVVRGEASKKTVGNRVKPSWTPDPKTGYYRPDHTAANKVEPAELPNEKH